MYIYILQYVVPDYFPVVYPDLAQPPTHHQAIINGFVYIHQTLHQANVTLTKRGARTMSITPRHYLDFINHYVSKGACLYYHPEFLCVYLYRCNAMMTTLYRPAI